MANSVNTETTKTKLDGVDNAATQTVAKEAVQPRDGTKGALVVSLLSRASGASIDELVEATGWLPHTTRAALTGLRKRGHAIERQTSTGGVSLYRIAAATPAPAKRRRKAAKAAC